MDTISFKRHRFPPEIIRRAVWLYARFALSYRDVEDLLAERGLDISYESVRRWFLKLGAPIARNLRHTRPIPNGYWHLDEMVIVIRGQRYWLWRGVDNEGEVLDFLMQSKRNAQAALKLMRKLLKKQGWTPTRITTDKLRSYHVAIRTLGLTAQHIDDKRANNRAENSHQPPLSAQGHVDQPVQSGLVRRHHLYPGVPRRPLPGGGHGLGESACVGLAVVEHPGRGLLRRGTR